MIDARVVLSAEEVGGAGLNGIIAPPPRPFLDARVCPRALSAQLVAGLVETTSRPNVAASGRRRPASIPRTLACTTVVCWPARRG